MQDREPTPEQPIEVKGVGDYDAETGKYKVDVVSSGKNLFDASEIHAEFPDRTTYIDNQLNVNIWKGSMYSSGIPVSIRGPVTVSCESGELSGCKSARLRIIGKSGTPYEIYFTDSNGNPIKGVVSRIIPENIAAVAFNYATTFYPFSVKNIQIEHGSTTTEYVPYREPIITNQYLPTPLMSGERLTPEGREVKWGVKVLDGSEYWQKSSTYTGGFFLDWTAYFNPAGKINSKFYCTHLTCVDTLDEYIAGTCYSDGSCCLRPNNTNTDLSVFKAWLKSEYDKGTPVTVWYQLSTPTTEEVETVPIETLDGNTYLETNTEVTPTAMSATYKSSEPDNSLPQLLTMIKEW